MANNGEIIIRIITEDGSGGNQVDTTGKKEVENKRSDLETTAILKCIENAAKQVYRISVAEAKYQINIAYSLTDNYRAQQNLNIASNIINRGMSAGSSIAGGFAVGGPVGAIIMAGVETIKLGLDIAHNYMQDDINIRKMDKQLSFQRDRAGYSLTAGSRGENR